jgi:glutamate synthase domain-containing protein 1
MCGIVGFLDKKGSQYPLGKTLLAMLEALGCRGPDSAGVALYDHDSDMQLHLSVPPGLDREKVLAALHELDVAPHRIYDTGLYYACIGRNVDVLSLEDKITRSLPGTEVLCLGRSLHLVKQVGSPAELDKTYKVREASGSHGIGHTRLSTESRVDLSHSQPFWAHGVPDLATVHNGHITNYHKLRRHYEQRGYRFYTENDSEVIGVYLHDRMRAGLSLEDALRSSLDDFDGSFSYLAASADCLAYVRDRYGFKPLILAETDDFVALATEEIALRAALGDDFVAREPAPGTMRVWAVKQEVPHGGVRVEA